jgi:hypothetical protein
VPVNELSLKDDRLLISEDESNCKTLDYKLDKVLKKLPEGAAQNVPREVLDPAFY